MYFYTKEIITYIFFFFFSSRRRHTRFSRDWSSDVCSSDLDLEQRLVPLHLVAELLEPLADRTFGDRFAHLGHQHVDPGHNVSNAAVWRTGGRAVSDFGPPVRLTA